MTLSIPSTTANPPPAPQLEAASLLDTSAVAELLACTARTVTNLITRGHLPAVRLGTSGAWRVHPDALTAFLRYYGHHDPAVVAGSTSPGDLPTVRLAPVFLHVATTPDGLRLVTLPPPDPDRQG